MQEPDDHDSTIILDAFHNWNSNSTLDDLRAIPLEKISHYHIDDAHPDIAPTEQKDPDRVMLGEGQIDLAAELAVLKKKATTAPWAWNYSMPTSGNRIPWMSSPTV